MFAGVVGGFRLQRACPGLTLVARDRGLLGNLIASAGTGIERVGVEDPVFERRFEALRHRPGLEPDRARPRP